MRDIRPNDRHSPSIQSTTKAVARTMDTGSLMDGKVSIHVPELNLTIWRDTEDEAKAEAERSLNLFNKRMTVKLSKKLSDLNKREREGGLSWL